VNSRARFEALRERAEGLLRERSPNQELPVDFKEMVQEFQVLQAELEVQAEELQRSHSIAERSRRHYFELFEHSPAGLLLLDPMYVVLDANRHASAMLERPLDQIRRSSVTRFIDAVDQPAFARLVKGVGTGTVSGEFTLRQAQGGRLVVKARLLVRDDGTFLMAIEDLTPLRRAETDAHQATERQRALSEHTSDGVAVLDALTRRLLETNPALCRMLETSTNDLLGRTREDLFSAETRLMASMALDQLWRDPASGPTPLTLRATSGRDVSVSVSCVPLGDKLTMLLFRRSLS
jgi:PAS domain-containing protein